MPGGVRRRASGLRREEVAVLANVSPTWYTFLEQGRRIRPSADVLDSLAGALRLDLTERRYLHALGAGQAESVLASPTPDATAVDFVRRLVEGSSGMGYPVYAIDGVGHLLAWNGHVSEWYSDFAAALPGHDRNMVWWLLTSPEARERLADWERDAREITARFRFVAGTTRADPRVDALLEDLRRVSADFARWWDTHDVTEQVSRDRRFNHPRLGGCTLQMFVVRPAISTAVSVVFHLPPAERDPAAN